ncbi:MAG: hypothetical protein DSY86_09080 [Marinomonas sp.]|nr:MAG: hypothetical protein DSY86_09080 [Marinomonas sp.]
MSELKKLISDTLKTSMRAKEKERVTIIRSIQAEIKRVEVDERIEVEDDRVLAILDKMVKQRKDSLARIDVLRVSEINFFNSDMVVFLRNGQSCY